MSERFEVVPDWVHVTHVESSEFREVYGFAGGGHGSVNLEGIRLRPKDRASKTVDPESRSSYRFRPAL